MLERYLAAHPLTDVRYMPQFPPMDDRAAWDSVADDDRAALLAYAQDWHERPWPVLTAGMYASFIRTGSRRDCEVPYFDRRRKLCSAVLHACLTNTDAFLADVEDGLWLLCEETTWAISAHAGLNAAHPFPDDQGTIVDLFAAQTAMILSLTAQLLQTRLHADVFVRVRREVERRVLRPFMEKNDEWWMGYTRKDLNNWTPWIISNILMSANVWQYGGTALVARTCMMLDRWLVCVPADGGCDEGAGYWNMAGGAFLDCLMALESMAGINLWQEDKVRRMMAYPALVYLGGGWFANFADCDARPYISGERLQYAGQKTGNAELIRMGVEMWGSPLKELSDTPHLSRMLMRILAQPAAAAVSAPNPKDVWLPDLQVRLVARGHLVAAMKGGHNAESHNHNDVGSFLVMAGGDMQVVDAGNMIYTAKTFSRQRYELWNCRAMYHNVPIIAGYEQQPGREFTAKDVCCTDDGMSLDLADAYPADAGVQRCSRVFRVQENRLALQEDITLAQPQEITWVFMLRHEPTMAPEGCTLPGGFRIGWETGLSAQVERIDITDVRMRGSYPGALWRLTLTAAPSDHHVQTFLFET